MADKQNYSSKLSIDNCQLPIKIWAIINVTPDSFYAGSRVDGAQEIVAACAAALNNGAHVLDIGGMSTRPGHVEIDENEEFTRLNNAITAIRAQFPTAALSIDTYRSSIVRRLHAAHGKFIVNDIQGGALDGNMYNTVAELGLDYVMMSSNADITSISAFFERQIGAARAAGVTSEIFVDPGFGFGKTIEQNFAVLKNLNRLNRFGKIFIGVSRKSMIFKTLGCTPDDALPGTCAIHWQALNSGANILRVHDVGAAAHIVKLFSMVVGV